MSHIIIPHPVWPIVEPTFRSVFGCLCADEKRQSYTCLSVLGSQTKKCNLERRIVGITCRNVRQLCVLGPMEQGLVCCLQFMIKPD